MKIYCVTEYFDLGGAAAELECELFTDFSAARNYFFTKKDNYIKQHKPKHVFMDRHIYDCLLEGDEIYVLISLITREL